MDTLPVGAFRPIRNIDTVIPEVLSIEVDTYIAQYDEEEICICADVEPCVGECSSSNGYTLDHCSLVIVVWIASTVCRFLW